MKKIFLTACIALLATASAMAGLSGKKVCIDPGHGDYTSSDRPMATIPYPMLSNGMPQIEVGFYETNTNLWKAKKLRDKLKAKGVTVTMTRDKNGVDLPLSTVRSIANNSGCDYFISIHSNAATEGTETQFVIILYSGKDNANRVSGSQNMANTMWPYTYESFEGGLEPYTNYSSTNKNVRGDVSFYGSSGTAYLGAISHSRPGYLVEGYFHTYQPARHRALNSDWCGQEGVRYYRGIAKYFSEANETTGYIMGVVKDSENKMTRSATIVANKAQYYYASGTHDQYVPINGAKVTLYNSAKEKVSEYNVDQKWNGVFVFEGLTPGTYYLDVKANGFTNLTDAQRKVVVTANKTSYPVILMKHGTYDENADFSTVDKISFSKLWSKTATELGLGTANSNRSMSYNGGNLYVADNGGKFHVVNASNGALASTATVDYSGVTAFARHNIRFTADGQMLVGNSNVDAGKLYLYSSDPVKGGATVIDTTNIALSGRSDFFYPYGKWNESGYFLSVLMNGNAVVKVPYSAGKLGTPVTINNTALASASGQGKAYPIDDNSFYYSRAAEIPTKHNLSTGAVIEEFGTDAPVSGVNVSGLTFFKIYSSTYMVTPTTRNGSFEVFDITNGISKATKVIDATANGDLGSETNATGTVDFCYSISGDNVFIYVLAPNNGVAAYKFAYRPTDKEKEEAGTKALTVNKTSLSFGGEQGTAIASQTITVAGSNLTATPSVTGGTDNFTIQSSLSATGGTITVTPKAGLAIGTHSSTLTIAADGISHKVTLSVTITEKGAAPLTPDATYGNVRFYLQGGKLDVPADNEALWELFKPDYEAYYNVSRADQPINSVTTFAPSLMQDFMTNTKSTWKWLGDYIIACSGSNNPSDWGTPEGAWRCAVHAFFNALNEHKLWTASGNYFSSDFTTAGKPEAWKAVYTFAHTPTKAGATFLGWYDNAHASGSPLTACPSSGDVYACWSGGNVATNVENVTAEVYLLPTLSGVEIFFDGTQPVAIYNVNGMRIAGDMATNYYACELQAGIYIVRVGNNTYKFVK